MTIFRIMIDLLWQQHIVTEGVQWQEKACNCHNQSVTINDCDNFQGYVITAGFFCHCIPSVTICYCHRRSVIILKIVIEGLISYSEKWAKVGQGLFIDPLNKSNRYVPYWDVYVMTERVQSLLPIATCWHLWRHTETIRKRTGIEVVFTRSIIEYRIHRETCVCRLNTSSSKDSNQCLRYE
jgi:hypothetical protein